MKVSRDELLHIAKLADLNIKDDEVDNYLKNLQDILNFADVVNSAPTEGLDETICANGSCNVFREDVVEVFDNHDGLMENAPEEERGMFKIPKVM